MSRRVLAASLVLVGTALLAACGDDGGSGAGGSSDDIVQAVDDGSFEADGEAVYKSHCAVCHGSDGQGGSGPELAGQVADKLTVAQHVQVVADGRAGMPAWGSSLEPDEIAAVVAYERDELGQ